MEFTSMIVHAAFLVLQIVAISLLPLGKRLIAATYKSLKLVVAVTVAVNFALAAALCYYWGSTALVVVEVIALAGCLVLVGRQDEQLVRGIKVLEQLGARRCDAADRFLFAWGKGAIYILRTREGRDAWLQEYLENGQPAWVVTEQQAADLVAKDPEFWAFRDMPRENPND